MKHVVMQCCHIAQWHDRLKRSGKAGMLVRTTPHGEQHSSTLCFPVGCWSPMDCTWVSNESWSRLCHKMCSTFCTTLWVTENLKCVGYPMKFPEWNYGSTVQSQRPCWTCTKGKVTIFWKNRHYGLNLGSLIWTKLEMPIKWMEAFRFSSYKESAPYTMCCEGDVHCGIRHWCDNTAPCCTSKTDCKRCLLLHVPAAPTSSSTGQYDDTWWYRTSSFFMTVQGVTPLLLSWTSCVTGNGRFWNIHHTHPIWVHTITISSPKKKNHYKGPGTTQDINLTFL